MSLKDISLSKTSWAYKDKTPTDLHNEETEQDWITEIKKKKGAGLWLSGRAESKEEIEGTEKKINSSFMFQW